jgi:hypothetical protein
MAPRHHQTKHMKYNINISPAWIGELGLIDDWGPEIDPKDIPVSWKHVKDLPADDPAVAAVLVDILIDENQLFKPNAG